MTSPREPDRFDKQSLDIVAAWNRSGGVGLGAAIAAALRAEHASALERAAQAVDLCCNRCGERIRALIPPAAAPAAEGELRRTVHGEEDAVPGEPEDPPAP